MAEYGVRLGVRDGSVKRGPPQRDRIGNERRVLMPREIHRSDALVVATGRSSGSDRTLPPSIRSIPERSKSSGIVIGCNRWSMTGRRQGPVSTACFFFKRPDVGSLPDRTHKHNVRSLLQQQFTSCELTGRWTTASGLASGGPIPANLQSSFALPVPNQVPT